MDFNLFLLFLPVVLIGYYILDLRGNVFIIFVGVIFFVSLFATGTISITGDSFGIANGTIFIRNVTEDNHIQTAPIQENPVQETPIIVPEKTEKLLNETWNNDWIHRT